MAMVAVFVVLAMIASFAIAALAGRGQ